MFTARSTPRSLYQCLRVANTQTPPKVYHPTSLHNVPRHYSHEAHSRLIASRSFRAEKQPRGHRLFPRARRRFSSSAVAMHEHLTPPKPGEELHVTFVDKDGEEHTFEVSHGDNLLAIAQDNDLEMEGACGGSCACSTCHVIVEDSDTYDKIPEPDDDENDMLDLAFGLTETSRLGCQVKMTKDIDGLRVRLPSMTRNLQASDFSGAKKS